MHHRVAAFIAYITILGAPCPSLGQMPAASDTLRAEPVVAREDSGHVASIGMLMLMVDRGMCPATSLSFYSRPDVNRHLMFGYEVYRASPYECALQGAGAGLTVGMAAGAFGMMMGAWDERRAWYIAGAAAAAGTLFGAVKSDDPEWNLRVRWEPDR